MARRYITTAEDGKMAIIQIAGDDIDGLKLTKTLFELSRNGDSTTHFDPDIHTLASIASGIPGHRPMSISGEVEENAIPTDRDNRNQWTYDGSYIRTQS